MVMEQWILLNGLLIIANMSLQQRRVDKIFLGIKEKILPSEVNLKTSPH